MATSKAEKHNTIIITKDYIILAPLAEDPTPLEGQLWYNATEKGMKWSDGVNIYSLKIPTPGLGKKVDAWEIVALVPKATIFAAGNGGLIADKDGYIYAASPETTDFYRFSTLTRTWEALPTLPRAMNYDITSFAYDPARHKIYMIFSGATDFYEYDIATRTFRRLASVPASIGPGGGLVHGYPEYPDLVFCVVGGATNSFYAYSIPGNTWTTRASTPFSVHWDSSMVKRGRKIYLTISRNFAEYDIGTNTWTAKNPPPESRCSLALIDDTIFAYSPSGLTYIYDVGANSWLPCQLRLPGSIDAYGAGYWWPISNRIVAVGDYIYFLPINGGVILRTEKANVKPIQL